MIKYFENMEEFRCQTCSKLFFKYKLRKSLVVEVKCTRCNNISYLVVEK